MLKPSNILELIDTYWVILEYDVNTEIMFIARQNNFTII